MKHTLMIKRNTAAVVAVLWLGWGTVHGFAAEPVSPTNAVGQVHAELPPVVGVKDFLKEPDAYAGKEIMLQGFVTEVCKRKGCWALLHDSDADAKGQIRVKQDEAGDTFKAFLPELQGKTILVTGEVKETRIDKDYLDKWEANVKSAQARAAQAGVQKPEGGAAYDPVLKQIANYRDRVAKAKSGHLSSYSLAVVKWELQAEKP